jgi:hypothetical protein
MVQEDILLTIQRTQIQEHEAHFQLKPLLLEMDKMDLLGIRNVGEKVIQELTERLYTHAFLPETTMGERITV